MTYLWVSGKKYYLKGMFKNKNIAFYNALKWKKKGKKYFIVKNNNYFELYIK